MAKKKETTEEKAPKLVLSKDVVVSLSELETVNEEVVASMDERNLETKKNEEQLAESRKMAKRQDDIDPVKRRELMRGNKE